MGFGTSARPRKSISRNIPRAEAGRESNFSDAECLELQRLDDSPDPQSVSRFHDFLTRTLYERQAGDTYRVQYKINSVKKIAATLEPIGFKKTQLILNGDPTYISFNRPLFALARLIEKILNLRPFRGGRVHLIGVYEK